MWYPALPSMSARFATDAATVAEAAADITSIGESEGNGKEN
jgi:hypothetical protein